MLLTMQRRASMKENAAHVRMPLASQSRKDRPWREGACSEAVSLSDMASLSLGHELFAFSELLQVEFPRKQGLRWSFVCRGSIRESLMLNTCG